MAIMGFSVEDAKATDVKADKSIAQKNSRLVWTVLNILGKTRSDANPTSD